MSQSTIFQLRRDGSSWVDSETVLSKEKCVLLKDSDAGEALTSGSSVWSQSLYQWATVLPVLALYHSCPSIFYLKYFGRFIHESAKIF